jgi:hypothetical protein
MKHGLLAQGITELDDRQEYKKICRKLTSELKPVSTVEHFLVRRAALAMIRVNRAARLEAEMLTAHLNPALYEDSNVDKRLSDLMRDAERRTKDPGLPATLSDSTVSALCEIYSRYETANENRLYRCLAQLERAQARRGGSAIQLEEPNKDQER